MAAVNRCQGSGLDLQVVDRTDVQMPKTQRAIGLATQVRVPRKWGDDSLRIMWV
jgi:hypothetical protein